MKKILEFAACCTLGMVSLAHADSNSKLTIVNNASDTTIEITNDTVCSGDFLIYPNNDQQTTTRWSQPLKENPIPVTPKGEKGVIVTWKNCAIIAKDVFTPGNDHSKMYFTINDLKSGEFVTYKFNIVNAKDPITKTIQFANRTYNLLITHTGDYGYNGGNYVQTTSTTITLNSVLNAVGKN